MSNDAIANALELNGTILANILKQLVILNAAVASRATAKQQSAEASDTELDSQYGDEPVKFKPRDYDGPARHTATSDDDDLSFIKLQRMSESHPDLLDQLAQAFDSFAAKDDAALAKTENGQPKSRFARMSARRARGWARRLSGGWKPPAPVAGSDIDWGGAGKI